MTSADTSARPGDMTHRNRGAEQAVKSSLPWGAWATHAALIVVQFAFASQSVEAKIAMLPRDSGGEGLRPEALAMIRMLGGALFFQALVSARSFAFARLGREPLREAPLSRADHARLLGLSILGIALNQTLFLIGLKWTTPFSVALLSATIPVFAAGLAVAFGREVLSARTVVGLVLALAGVLSLTGIGTFDRGALLVSINSLSYAAYVVLSRGVVLRVGALRSVAWVFTYGALLFAPLGLTPMLASLPELTPRGTALVAYIVAMPTIVAYLFNAWALGRSSASLVTIYIYLQPLIAAVLARIQLGQAVSRRAGLAAVLILAGLSVVLSRAWATRRPR